MDAINNPTNYEKMCEPHESDEQADEAISKFYEEVYELRNKYKIADVHFVISTPVKDEGRRFSSAHFGDTTRAQEMLLIDAINEAKKVRGFIDATRGMD